MLGYFSLYFFLKMQPLECCSYFMHEIHPKSYLIKNNKVFSLLDVMETKQRFPPWRNELEMQWNKANREHKENVKCN